MLFFVSIVISNAYSPITYYASCLVDNYMLSLIHLNRKMAENIGKAKPVASFEYELFEGDPDHLRTVVATPAPTGPWIDPASLKLKYRIGRGSFGDVWLATNHQSSVDYEEYHELAVKVLHPLNEDHSQKFMDKFEELFFKLRGLHGVCWLHGISIIDEKVPVLEIN